MPFGLPKQEWAVVKRYAKLGVRSEATNQRVITRSSGGWSGRLTVSDSVHGRTSWAHEDGG